jgi:hypothetical protein
MTQRAKKKVVVKSFVAGDPYNGLLHSVGELLERARRQSARSINTILTTTYWEIGRRIVEYEQAGEKKAEYGEILLKRLAVDLTSKFGRGFGWRNIFQMRLFYLAYPQILQTLSAISDVSISQTLSGISGIPISPTMSAKLDENAIPQTLSVGSDIFQMPSEKLEIDEKYQTPSGNSDISATPSRKSSLSDLIQAFPLPWSHYVRLLSVGNLEARTFYEAVAIRGG